MKIVIFEFVNDQASTLQSTVKTILLEAPKFGTLNRPEILWTGAFLNSLWIVNDLTSCKLSSLVYGAVSGLRSISVHNSTVPSTVHSSSRIARPSPACWVMRCCSRIYGLELALQLLRRHRTARASVLLSLFSGTVDVTPISLAQFSHKSQLIWT